MTTRYAAKHGAGLQNTLNAIKTQFPFKAGNLTGSAYRADLGRLPGVWRREFVPVYAVYSYETPIAWFTASGEWIVPAVKYSATTSAHQSVVRSALGLTAAQMDQR